MGFYERHILPRGIHFVCGRELMAKQRRKVVPEAEGRVLELGIGSGLNLPFYDPKKVARVWGIDPSAELAEMAEEAAAHVPFEVALITRPAEELPLEDASVDTVVVTFALCTIPDAHAALEQARRVLKPGGRLLFCEHGLAPDEGVGRWQRRLDPLWSRVSGGCHLDRPMDALIRDAGFAIERLDTGYIAAPKTHTFLYWGSAQPR